MKRPQQAITSADTSINSIKVPAVFSAVRRLGAEGFGAVNLDYGGGRFDTATAYLAPITENLIYDPFNRSKEHNAAMRKRARTAETATISNVLNVIAEAAARRFAVSEALKMIQPGGRVFITVYEGDRSGKGRITSSGYQLNQPLSFYETELRSMGFTVARKGPLLIVTK